MGRNPNLLGFYTSVAKSSMPLSTKYLLFQNWPKVGYFYIGWNSLSVKKEHPIFKYVKDGDYVYFVHSYYAAGCDDSLLATTDYGMEITAAVALDNISGTQFHPEKSGEVGLSILKAFSEW